MRDPIRRAGFTLVEIIIAFAILLVFTVGVFMMLSRFSKIGNVGQWRSATTGQMRKAQERIRMAIESASYPMKITPQSNQMSDLKQNYVIVNPSASGSVQQDDNATQVVRVFGPSDSTSQPGADDVVLQLVQSKPGREGLGSTGAYADKPVEATLVQFVLKKSNAIYGGKRKWDRTLFLTEDYKAVPTSTFTSSTPYDFSGAQHSQTLLLNDVNELRIAVQKDGLSSGNSTPIATPLEVDILCVEPTAGEADVRSRVKAQPNAGIEIN